MFLSCKDDFNLESILDLLSKNNEERMALSPVLIPMRADMIVTR